MLPTLDEISRIVLTEAERSGYDPVPPVTPAELQALSARAIDRLGTALPEPYLAFLAITDGFYVRGMQLYSSHERPLVRSNGTEHPGVRIDDVIQMTLELREDPLDPSQHLIFLARDSADRGWDPVKGQ